MLLAPLAVLPVALAAAALGWAAGRLGAGALLSGLVVVAAVALGTRALHLDGLADTVDGLGSGRPADQALAIMRRGDVGPMGVVALVLVLAGQAAALGAHTGSLPGAVLVTVVLGASRTALALACARGVPAARPDGLGAAVAGSVPRTAAAAAWLAVAAVMATAGWAANLPWWQGPVVAAVAAAAVAALVHRCVRRLGGVTGDVLGAAIEVAATVLAVGMAL